LNGGHGELPLLRGYDLVFQKFFYHESTKLENAKKDFVVWLFGKKGTRYKVHGAALA
jgi:hypothetical protein